jgi:cytochrome P450
VPSWADQPSLPYLRSLIKEVHRWGPIASLGIPHAATQDDIYEGMVIPIGTVCFPNITALSQDPERYPKPETFDPERFMNDEVPSAASAMSADYMTRDHFHYGFGRRLCPGILIAEASLFIFVSRVIWGFDVQAEEGVMLDMKDLTGMYIST